MVNDRSLGRWSDIISGKFKVNTVKCPLCDKEVEVLEGQTRTDALIKHLRDVPHNGDTSKEMTK